MAACALLFEGTLDRVLIASDTDFATQVPVGTAMMVDQLWSTENLEIADDGGGFRRSERLRRIAAEPPVHRSLRVCWQNPGGAYNCGRCRKCLITMVALEALGARQRFQTFPPDLDLALLAHFSIATPMQLALWEDLLILTGEAERPDLERAVEPVVASGKRALGLPQDFSMRPSWGRQALAGALRGAAERAAAATRAEAEAQRQLAEALGSRSWRLTQPLRRLGDGVRRRKAQ